MIRIHSEPNRRRRRSSRAPHQSINRTQWAGMQEHSMTNPSVNRTANPCSVPNNTQTTTQRASSHCMQHCAGLLDGEHGFPASSEVAARPWPSLHAHPPCLLLQLLYSVALLAFCSVLVCRCCARAAVTAAVTASPSRPPGLQHALHAPAQRLLLAWPSSERQPQAHGHRLSCLAPWCRWIATLVWARSAHSA